jgi:DNA-binding LacI/PurR family transcriptional regulator
MNDSQSNRTPQRRSLVEETIDVLKEGIECGRWCEMLPGEYELCADLHVSRTTLRKALQALHRKKVLTGGGHGKRHQLVAAQRSRKTPHDAWQGNEVRVLSTVSERDLVGITKTALQQFHSEVESAGLVFRFDYCPRLKSRRKDEELRELTNQPTVAGWVLYFACEAVQHWFARSGLPAMVCGTRFPGVKIPCVEYANLALGRHAGLEFLRRGHQCIAFIYPAAAFAGDVQCAEGLREAVDQCATGQAEVVDGKYEPTLDGIRRLMDRLIRRPQPPTAFLVAQPNFVWPVIGCLQLAGRAVPRDAAVISRADDLFLTTSLPEVTRYRHDGVQFGKASAQIMVSIIRGHVPPDTIRMIVPDFVLGETVGPVSARSAGNS